MDKPTKPTDLMPRTFGGVKNNFSASLQQSGYEDGVPAIYGGDNLNYQLDATGKELDYCETICDFINAIPIGKTITVDVNNKLVYENLATDISGKADIDLSNVNSTGLSYGAGWAMPSGTSTNFTVGASGSTYTAPATGWFACLGTALGAGSWVSMVSKYGNTDTVSINTVASSANEGLYCYVPIYKNQKMKLTYLNVSHITVKFVYAMGEV